MRSKTTASERRGTVITAVLCVLASLADGFDLQALGLMASSYASEFRLSPAKLGWIFTLNSVGLLIGATLGGWIADRFGRRIVLVASVALFGVGSVATAIATSGEQFLWIRVVTGMGLGAALANIIAMVAEIGSAQHRARRVTLITAANPLGGAIPGTVLSFWPDLDWRAVFHLGGWIPLGIAVLMLLYLPESPAFRRAQQSGEQHQRVPILHVVFGERRAAPSVLLWIGFFATLAIIYLLASWLPSILRDAGMSSQQVSVAALLLMLGGAIGTVVLGFIAERLPRPIVMAVAYTCVMGGLSVLAFRSYGPEVLWGIVFVTGFFLIGAQFLLYGLSPTFYPTSIRATGVGTAVSIGRLGAIFGPAMAGILLSFGLAGSTVLAALLPLVVTALIAAVALTRISTVGAND